jgi:hypothetical protein
LGGLPNDNWVRKGTNYDLSNQKLVEGGFTNLLERYSVEKIHVVTTLALGSRPRQKGLQGCGPKGSIKREKKEKELRN